MAYLTKIEIRGCRNVKRAEIELLSPAGSDAAPVTHLILTGANGSGKTGVLEQVASELNRAHNAELHPAERAGTQIGQLTKHVSTLQQQLAQIEGQLKGRGAVAPGPLPFMPGAMLEQRRVQTTKQLEVVRAQLTTAEAQVVDWRSTGRPVCLQWSAPAAEVRTELDSMRCITAFRDAARRLKPARVAGPTTLNLSKATATANLADSFLQFLVNARAEQSFANDDGDTATVSRLRDWFASLTDLLRQIYEDPGLTFQFDRVEYNFRLTRGDGYSFDLTQLADGHAAILAILAELILRVDAAQRAAGDRSFQPSGVVVVDEIEAHLHLRLQAKVMPFLVATFPSIQFIVATHSPAVISSIPNAVVYDLGTHSTIHSSELQGVRYGSVMVDRFGLTDDIDIDSALKLSRLRKLIETDQRTAQEESELKHLAADLSARSPSMALEVWRATQHGGPA